MEAKATSVDVSVLIPVRNEEQHIEQTARAMLAQQFDGDVEFLFMDGRSEDRTREALDRLARTDPRVLVLDNPARSTTNGLNVGLATARGEFVARMDAHSFYPPNYLAAAVERLRRGDVEWVIGSAIPRGEGRWSRCVALALGSWLGVGGSRKWGGSEEIDVDTGVFTGVVARSTLAELGGWDEHWPVNQDSELAARVIERGGRIVCLPEIGAHYVPRDSLQGLARQYWRFGFYRAKTSRRHPASMRGSHLLAPGLVVTIALAAAGPRRLRRAARAALCAYAVALVAGTSHVASERQLSADDAAVMPLVFATMHLAWGGGFIANCAREGLPSDALRDVLTR